MDSNPLFSHVDDTDHQSRDPREMVAINDPPVRHLESGDISFQDGYDFDRMEVGQDTILPQQLPLNFSRSRLVGHNP